ncbi:MAG: glycosyltransferase [Candidatus Staskawiczbacteria bacterium]|nr:glycosyltransferase [Candidatus Staskawiczbacteria bacterium]
MSLPLISVVVSIHRPPKTIKKCLESIKNQTYKNIELVVVDDFDNKENKYLEFIYSKARYFQDGPERSIKQNRGVREAKGDFILALDQDMELSEDVIELCYNKLSKENIVGVKIPEISIGEGFWTKCIALDRYISSVLEDSLNESCRFFRKKDFLKIGGYDKDIVGVEDSDLHYRLLKLGKISKIESLIYHDEGKTKFWRRVKKKYYYSRAFRKYFKRRPHIAVAQFFPIKLAYFKHPIILIKQPIVTLGMIVLRGCEVVAGVIGFFAFK